MDEGPIKKRTIKRATQRALIMGGSIAAIVVVAGSAVYFTYSAYRERADAALKASQEMVAGELGAAFAETIGDVRSTMTELAKEPTVIEALKSGDPGVLAERAAALRPLVPDAVGLRLLPRDTREIDPGAKPPLKLAALDMLNRARASDAPIPAEVHLYGSDDQHLAFVERVVDENGTLLGFLHAGVAMERVAAALSSLPSQGGYLELHQRVLKGDAVVIGRAGGKTRPPGIEYAEAPVDGTIWNLAYWGEPELVAGAGGAAAGGGAALVWAALGAVLLLAGGGAFVFVRGRGAGRAGERVVVYQGAVRAIMEGAHPGLEHLVPGLEPSVSGRRPAAGAPIEDRLAGEDITSFARAPAGRAPAAVGSEEPIQPGAAPPKAAAKAAAPAARAEAAELPENIFRAYDIRGIAGETLTAAGVYAIGKALGSEAYERGQQGLVIGRDGRASSPELAEALIRGLRDSGRDVIDIGLVPTPVLYFATHYLDTASGVMVTGSHNPPQYNGMKIVLDGETLSGDAIKAIRERVASGDATSGAGSLQSAEILPEYIRRISEDIPVALGNAYKLVIDCGNGVAGAVAPQLFRALGHDVIELYCEVDGSFPNHHPDPSQPENLADLIDMVKLENADLGLAFDGDGDRLGVVDGEGNIIWPDRQMMLLARDVLSRCAGAQIIFDVKCSNRLAKVIEAAGGKPLMWKTGHSLIKSKMKEIGAPLAGEMSGHIFFKERWYGFDDALYAAARLLEVLLAQGKPPLDVFKALPGGVATPEIRVDVPEESHGALMKKLIAAAKFEGAKAVTIDGLRVDFADSWGLVRPSNTMPCLVLRFEGNDAAALASVQGRFRKLFAGVAPGLKLPF
jgi:phosphomannomutase/phosphoglucomutase